MSYQRKYLQQTQSRSYSAGTPGTPSTTTSYLRPVNVPGMSFQTQMAIANQRGYVWNGRGWSERITETTPGTPGTPGTMQQARLRRGEVAGGDLRLQMARGKQSLRIDPAPLGELESAISSGDYDPISSGTNELVVTRRRRRGAQLDLAINPANTAVGINTL
jgi:hypothetical protein